MCQEPPAPWTELYFIASFMSSRISVCFGLFAESMMCCCHSTFNNQFLGIERMKMPSMYAVYELLQASGYLILINRTYSSCINHSDNVNKKQSIIPMDVRYGGVLCSAKQYHILLLFNGKRHEVRHIMHENICNYGDNNV